MVVRAIFLEDPERAYPEVEDKDRQRTIMALEDEDPLRLADELGRPMAILRLGSRVPDTSGLDSGSLFGSPPIQLISDGVIQSQPYDTTPPLAPGERIIDVSPIPDAVIPSGVPSPTTTVDPQPIIDKQETTPNVIDPFLDDPAPIEDLPQP